MHYKVARGYAERKLQQKNHRKNAVVLYTGGVFCLNQYSALSITPPPRQLIPSYKTAY